jgi:ADP-heptose:LPS heptosyltransferase
MELARVIAGASVFIGNQSAPMAIAAGLGKNLIEECWQGNPNCLFPKRKNAIFWGVDTTSASLDIPPHWLNSVADVS